MLKWKSQKLNVKGDGSKINHTGMIFYQGASVEPMAYVPLLSGIAEAGYTVYAPQFPCGMAVFDVDKAEEVMAQHPEIKAWYIAGHSMGGRYASKYALTDVKSTFIQKGKYIYHGRNQSKYRQKDIT